MTRTPTPTMTCSKTGRGRRHGQSQKGIRGEGLEAKSELPVNDRRENHEEILRRDSPVKQEKEGGEKITKDRGKYGDGRRAVWRVRNRTLRRRLEEGRPEIAKLGNARRRPREGNGTGDAHAKHYPLALRTICADFERISTLNKIKLLAKSEEHLQATKELFGTVLHQRDDIKMTLDEAGRLVQKKRSSESLLEDFDKLKGQLNKACDRSYRTFDSDEMNRVLEFCDCSLSWCQSMKFWEGV